jgi:hypothetical protein
MTNWTIFLLHFCAAIFYIAAGHIKSETLKNDWLFTMAIVGGTTFTIVAVRMGCVIK